MEGGIELFWEELLFWVVLILPLALFITFLTLYVKGLQNKNKWTFVFLIFMVISAFLFVCEVALIVLLVVSLSHM